MISDILYLSWLATLAVLPFVTIAAHEAAKAQWRCARGFSTVTFAMAVACVVFPVAETLVGEFVYVPREPAESIGHVGFAFLSILLGVPCAVVSGMARARSPGV